MDSQANPIAVIYSKAYEKGQIQLSRWDAVEIKSMALLDDGYYPH